MNDLLSRIAKALEGVTPGQDQALADILRQEVVAIRMERNVFNAYLSAASAEQAADALEARALLIEAAAPLKIAVEALESVERCGHSGCPIIARRALSRLTSAAEKPQGTE